MLLQDKFKLELRLRELQEQLPSLKTFADRIEAEDEILDIKKQLGEFKQSIIDGEECINCSG